MSFASIFIDGTIITFALALLLVIAGLWPLAAGLILLSPFPCPPGMPC